MNNSSPSVIARVALAIAIVLSTTVVVDAQSDRTRRVRFARGRTTKVINDSVVRGTQDRYIVRARAGQTLIVHITSLEDNAVFDVYQTGTRRRLADETMEWTGELPRSGDYTIEVGGTRGNATYTLEITIR